MCAYLCSIRYVTSVLIALRCVVEGGRGVRVRICVHGRVNVRMQAGARMQTTYVCVRAWARVRNMHHVCRRSRSKQSCVCACVYTISCELFSVCACVCLCLLCVHMRVFVYACAHMYVRVCVVHDCVHTCASMCVRT